MLLARPLICPCPHYIADLGIQRGLLRWVLSLHAPDYGITISPEKLKAPEDKKDGKATPKSAKAKGKGKGKGKKAAAPDDEDALPVFHDGEDVVPEGLNANMDVSSVPPGPAPAAWPSSEGSDAKGKMAQVPDIPFLPAPFTPSINKTLSAISGKPGKSVPALPAGLTVATLRSRLDPKKKVKWAIPRGMLNIR